jgi:hypothetical protein
VAREDVGVTRAGPRIVAAVNASVADAHFFERAAAQRRLTVVGENVEKSLHERVTGDVDSVSERRGER